MKLAMSWLLDSGHPYSVPHCQNPRSVAPQHLPPVPGEAASNPKHRGYSRSYMMQPEQQPTEEK
jgi:hypothetical protein